MFVYRRCNFVLVVFWAIDIWVTFTWALQLIYCIAYQGPCVQILIGFVNINFNGQVSLLSVCVWLPRRPVVDLIYLKGSPSFSFLFYFVFFFSTPLWFLQSGHAVRMSRDTQLTTLRAAAVLLDREKTKQKWKPPERNSVPFFDGG